MITTLKNACSSIRRLLAIIFVLTVFAAPALAQETRTVTDDTGTKVEIPVKPLRIVSLHDSVLTIPLLELGVIPVGSHGRGKSAASAYIRTGQATTGIDFNNSNIEWVGGNLADIELIAALKPDLILTTQWQKADVEKLRLIAPTLVFNFTSRTDWNVYARLAELTGTTDKMQRMLSRYESQIAQIKAVIDTKNILVSTIHANAKGLYVFNPAGNIGKVLIDAGFQRPKIISDIKDGDRASWFSAESMPEFDGDFIITAYRWGVGDTPQDVRGYFKKTLPSYCELLHACRENQMIMLSMDEVTATSFHGLSAVAYAILSEIGGKPFVPMAR
ncbi:MAG: ABC transporter substrate-binding protein [Alphaproteobacteria bacterium]|nr:ABC transporter substrate-binding protein [Alphaproteobacteria bacterium]